MDMNKNNIELYICNNYNEYTDMCKNFVKDNSLFEADKTARFYFTFSENSDNARFFLLVDNKENKVLTYSFIESDHDETTNISSEDCLYIDFIHTPLSKNTQKGYASLMLDYIFDYARAKGYQKVHLMALGRNPRYLYYKKGFINDSHPNKISVSMYKILDQNDWACSVLISEALNNSNQHTSPSQTLKNIIKYKQYDNMFEFGVMEENEYGNKKQIQ